MASSTLSVVIPTLGNDCLRATIEQLNRGSVKPDEILVCIPREFAENAAALASGNVTIVRTERRGQVSQRAIGFAAARSEYVLQLDDDMLVERDCLERLLAAIAVAGPNAAVAASLINKSNGQSFYRAPRRRGLLWIYYLLLNGTRGYVPGTITRAGTNVGVDPAANAADLVPVEWVPGGCVLHRRANLVLDHFYPFKGKAYCEDLFHSHYLKTKGVALAVSTEARCIVDDVPFLSAASLRAFAGFVRADFRARTHLVRLSRLSMPRMYVFYAVLTARYFLGRIVHRPRRPA